MSGIYGHIEMATTVSNLQYRSILGSCNSHGLYQAFRMVFSICAHYHIYIYIYIFTYTYIYIHIYLHTHIFTYTYIYIHIYLHTCTCHHFTCNIADAISILSIYVHIHIYIYLQCTYKRFIND